MLNISNIKKYYVKNKPVIADLSLSFPDTGLHIIAGKSGCGKTTLLNLIGTMDQDYSGSIKLDGKELSKLSYQKIIEYRNYDSAYIFQIDSLFEHLSVEENIQLALQLQGKISDTSSVLEMVGLKGFEKRKVKGLSGGEKQRVGIARALAKDSKIILADEPTSALDSKNSHKIFSLLKEISKEKLVIVVTHDVKKAVLYADRMIRLVDGKVVEDNVINENTNKANTYDKKPSLPNLLWPIFRFQFLRTLVVNLFISLILAASLIVLNIAKEQENIKDEYTAFYERGEFKFNAQRALEGHIANDINMYNVVPSLATDKPYTYFQEVSYRNGGLIYEDHLDLKGLLAPYDVYYGNAEYGNIYIQSISKEQLRSVEDDDQIWRYWYEPESTPYTHYLYDDTINYDIIYGQRPILDNDILVTDTIADHFLRSNKQDASDLSAIIGQEIIVYDIYGKVDNCVLYVERPFIVRGVIRTSQLQYYYFEYNRNSHVLLDSIVQQTHPDPYMNSATFKPYGYIVTNQALDSYLSNHYYGEGLSFENISYNENFLNFRTTTTFHGYYDYRGISSYVDNIILDKKNRIEAYDYSKIIGNNLSGNQILITLNFAHFLFPDLKFDSGTSIPEKFNQIKGTEITLSFHSVNGIKEVNFEIVGVTKNTYNSYFYVSEEMYSELHYHKNLITYPSITVNLENASSLDRMRLIETLYKNGYVLVPVSMAPGVWGEFVPTQGEVILIDDEGFEEEVNISIHNLFSIFYNTSIMNDTNYTLEIVSTVSSFVLVMAIILSLSFVYLKERRQKNYTQRLTAMGVASKKIIRMNLINYVMITMLVFILSIFGTSIVVKLINKNFVLAIADVGVIAYIDRIRILFTEASYIRIFAASFLVLILGILTATFFVHRSKK